MKILVIILTALFGLSLAGCGSNSTDPVAIKTVIRSAHPQATPKSCIDALNDAERLVHGPVVAQLKDSSRLAQLVPMALDAGLTANVAEAQQVNRELQSLSGRASTRTTEITQLVSQYNADSAKCRAAAGEAG